MPTSGILGSLGLGSFPSTSSTPLQPSSAGTAGLPVHGAITAPASTTLSSILAGGMQPAAMGVAMAGAAGSSKAMDTIVVAPGVPALKWSLVNLILAGKFTDLGELPPARGFGKTPAALSSDIEGKNCTVSGSGLCPLQEAHPRPRYVDAVLRDILGGLANQTSRKGPIIADVRGHNRTSEQEVSLASLDNMTSIFAKRQQTLARQTGRRLTAASIPSASRGCR